MTTVKDTIQTGRKFPVTIYVNEAELKRIDRMAERAERSRSNWARRTLLAVIENQESGQEETE